MGKTQKLCRVKCFFIPVGLLLISLVGAGYLLGVPFNQKVPVTNVTLVRTCSSPQKKQVSMRLEKMPIPGRPNESFAEEMKLSVREQSNHPGTCTAIQFVVRPWPTSAYLESVEVNTAPGGGAKVTKTPLLPLRDPQYHIVNFELQPTSEANAETPPTLDDVVLSGFEAQQVGFSTKAMTINFLIDNTDDRDVSVNLTLPEGFSLDSSTFPAPLVISPDGPTYGFRLTAEMPFALGGGNENSTFRIVYSSDWRKKLQDYLLFVLAAIFGCAVQLLIDSLKDPKPTRI